MNDFISVRHYEPLQKLAPIASLQMDVQCAISIGAFVSSPCFSEHQTWFGNLFSQGSESQSAFSTRTTNFCSACHGNLTGLFRNVANSCTNDINATTIDMLTSTVSMPCIKNGGELCMPTLRAFMGVEWNSGANASVLDTICVPCLRSAVYGISQMMPESIRALFYGSFEMFCTQDPDVNNVQHYCYLEFQGMSRNVGWESNCRTGCIAKMLGAIVYAKGATATNQDKRMATAFKNICNRDGSQLCMLRIMNSMSGGSRSNDPCHPGGVDAFDHITFGNETCPTGCGAQVQTGVNQMGCCGRTLVSLIALSNNNALPDAAEDFFVRQCGVTFSTICQSNEQVKINLVIPNVKASYYNANKEAVKAAVLADVAGFAGVDSNSVTLTASAGLQSAGPALMASGDGLTVQVTVTARTSLQAAAVKQSYTRAIGAGDIPILKTSAAVPATGRVDPWQPMVVNVSASTVSSSTIGAASTATPAIISLVVVIASVLSLVFSA